LNDPLWSARVLLEAPEEIERLHYDYYVAGADVATTASYQATFEGFAGRGLGGKDSERLLRLSVELAVRARDRFWSEPSHRIGRSHPRVAASIGCYGASLHDGSEYRGDYGLTRKELMDFHRRRLSVLADSPAELLAFETIPSLLEAQALVSLLEERDASPPSWISFSCRNAREVSHGESIAECFAVASESEAVFAVGINCTAPRFVSGLLESAKGVTGKQIAVYPNSGESWDAIGRVWTGDPSGSIVELAPDWQRLGASLIGGCCRTSPATIRGLRARLSGQQVVP
jgi:homocysteine S-methyltransferase